MQFFTSKKSGVGRKSNAEWLSKTLKNALNVEGKEITKPSEIAEHFNDFFAAIGPKLSSLIEDTQHNMWKTSES